MELRERYTKTGGNQRLRVRRGIAGSGAAWADARPAREKEWIEALAGKLYEHSRA